MRIQFYLLSAKANLPIARAQLWRTCFDNLSSVAFSNNIFTNSWFTRIAIIEAKTCK